MSGLNLGTGRATDATVHPNKEATHSDVGKNADRPETEAKGVEVNADPGTNEPKPTPHREGKADVETRLDPTQPVSGDSDAASKSPESVAKDPPTPASERKDTLETQDAAKEEAAVMSTASPEADSQLRNQLERSLEGADEPENANVERWSSHPILRYKLGRFRFEDGLLALREGKDVEEFEKLLDKLPIAERARIKKIDLSAAEAISRDVRENGPKTTKTVDSSVGDRDNKSRVGSGKLEGE